MLSSRTSLRPDRRARGMNAILTRAFGDLRGNRLQNGLVFLIILAATTTLCLALTISRGADDSWDRTFEEANGAHLTFFGATAEDLAGIPALDGVTASSGPFPTIWADHSLVHDGGKYKLVLFGMPSEPPAVARPIVTDGSWLTANPDEIVLERTLAQYAGVDVGDRVLVTVAGGLREMTVAGQAVNTSRGTYPDWDVGTAWVSTETLAAIEPNPDQTLFVRLANPEDSEGFAAHANTIFPALNQFGTDDWHEVRDNVTEWNTVVSIFLGVFSIVALVAVAFVIANAIGGRVLAQFRDIGLLKAIGFTPSQVTLIFLIENLLIALVAGVLGIALAALIAPLFLQSTADMLNTSTPPGFYLDLALLTLLGVLVLVTLFTWLPAWRGGRAPTVQALTRGFEPARAGTSRIARLAERLRMPTVIVTGVKDAFARPLRAGLTIVALTMTVLTLTFALSAEAMTARLVNNPALEGDAFDMRIERVNLSDAEARAILAEQPEIDALHTRSWIRAQVPGQAGETNSFGVRVLGGDYARFPYVIGEGSMIAEPGQAVVGIGLMNLLDVEIGDELPVTIEDNPVTLQIVGRILDNDDDAQLAYIDAATVQPLFPDATPTDYALLLAPGSDEAAIQRRLLETSNYDFNVWRPRTETPEEATTIRTIMLGLSGVLLVIGLVNVLTTTLLNIRERMRDFGILKAVGMTPRQVMLSVASGAVLLALPAVLLGIPVGLWAWKQLFRIVAENEMGADPELFTEPSWWSLVLLAPGMIALAVLASTIPARRAARVEVAEVLRYE
jgi:putative ABC transport system permease protein